MGKFSECRILVSNPVEPAVLPVAAEMRKLGFTVEEFDSRVMSWPYRVYMKPIQRLMTNFKMDLDLFARSIYSIHPYREEKLRQAIIHFCPQILFVIRGHGYSRRFLGEMKERCKIEKLIGWWTKGSKWYELAEAEVDDYDLFFLMNEDFVTRLRQSGHHHCYFLPHAANRSHYYPLNLEKTISALFVGTWSRRRQRFMESVLSLRPVIYGPKWKQSNLINFPLLKSLRRGYLSPERVNERYNQAKVVLNINVLELSPGLKGGLNQRIFDVPASGAFLLTEYGKGIEELFKIGEEIETFSSEEELQDKATFYLRNEGSRDRIARKGHEKAKRFWTWEQRAKEISQYISGGIP